MKTKLVFLACFVCMAFFYSNSQKISANGILVYFIDGIHSESTVVKGKTVKTAKITNTTVRNVLAAIAVQEDSIKPALPQFNRADTLRILSDGREIRQADMSRLYKIRLKKGEDAEKIIEHLKKLPEVLYAEPDGISVPCIAPNDTHYLLWQWNMNNRINPGRDIHAEAAWNIYTGNPNNIIAVIDGGVLESHIDLNDKITGGDTGIGSWESHGTHVAGIAAAESNNGVGVTGVDWNARIHPQRVDLGGDADTYQAIVDAVNYSPNVRVLNNSYALTYEDRTPGRYSTTVRQAVAYAYKNNRVFVAAMGNEQLTHPNVINYPAGYPNVIAVGSTNNNDVIAGSSVNGNHIDVCAPGVNIYSTILGNTYGHLSGTSMATPHVAGIASLLKGYYANLDNDDIENIIKLSADDRGDIGFDIVYGSGRVNAERALNYLRSPYTLVQNTASSGTIISTSSQYVAQFISASGLATANYLIKRIEVQKTITLPSNLYNFVGVWGRGTSSAGWSAASPNFGEGFCEVVPGSLTSTSATLRTYVYQVWSIAGSYLGYYPTTPSNATFAYSVLGLEKPTISGPSTLCDQATYTVSNQPAQVAWSSTPSNAISHASSGNPLVVTRVGSGQATLTAVVNGIAISKNIWLGSPLIPTIIGPQHVEVGSMGSYSASVSGDFGTTYQWSVSPSSHTIYSSGANATIYFNAQSDYTITVIATNACGTTTTYYYVATGELEPFSIYPNPATDLLTVSYNSATENKDDIENNKNMFTIQLWNETNGLVKSIESNSSTKQISLRGLPKGMYSVHIVKENKTVRKQLIWIK
jgi:hypothetical protein